jgi:hypothetical protein
MIRHSKWYPITGGSNVPAVNKFLDRFGVSFGLQAFKGSIRYENSQVDDLLFDVYVCVQLCAADACFDMTINMHDD